MTTLEIILFVIIFLWLINISSRGDVEIDYDVLTEEVKDRIQGSNFTEDYDDSESEIEDTNKYKI